MTHQLESEQGGELLKIFETLIIKYGGRDKLAADIENEWLKTNWETSNRKWTSYDYEYIICNHATTPYKQMAEHFGVTFDAIGSVISRARHQGVNIGYKKLMPL